MRVRRRLLGDVGEGGSWEVGSSSSMHTNCWEKKNLNCFSPPGAPPRRKMVRSWFHPDKEGRARRTRGPDAPHTISSSRLLTPPAT